MTGILIEQSGVLRLPGIKHVVPQYSYERYQTWRRTSRSLLGVAFEDMQSCDVAIPLLVYLYPGLSPASRQDIL